MSAREFSLGDQDLRRGVNGVFCSISPDKITFGDGSWTQIDFSIVPSSYVEETLKSSVDTEATVGMDGQWSRPSWRIEYPVDPDGPTKEATGGTTWFISTNPGKWLQITKWAKGNVHYEAEVRGMLEQLDVSEPLFTE